MKKKFGDIAFWIFLGLLVLLLIRAFSAVQQHAPEEIDYVTLRRYIRDGKITEAEIIGNENIKAKAADGTEYKVYIPYPDDELINELYNSGVKLKGSPPPESKWYMQLLYQLVPVILILALLWYLFSRSMAGGGKGAMSFGKSRAKLFDQTLPKINFDSVAGCDEAKQELQEVIEFLKEPQKFQRLGGRIPKGVLLIGPPGTGKTLLARAVAGEANVKFLNISGSDFVEMFVGVGASRVRDLFDQGKKFAPSIIFIDEIDAVGRQRGAGIGGGHDEREQTLNALLVEMDGFETKEGVIIMAATNRPDVLDSALLRPGRFDRQVIIDIPDLNGRLGILKVHTKKVPMHKEVNLKTIAKGTPGFSGADIENLVNEACLLAARRNKKSVEMDDFEEAKDKVLMGPERRSVFISEEEKKRTAYHEAGHAIVGEYMPEKDTIHKITIIPRGRALGLTMHLPEGDKHMYTKQYWKSKLAVLLGGRVAESVFFDDITTGAANDIERATSIARKMVCEWGMSALGPLAFGKKDQSIFLGRELTTHKDFSERTAIKIDEAIRDIINEAIEKAREIITSKKKLLENLARTLIKKEALDAEEIKIILAGGKIKIENNNGESAVNSVFSKKSNSSESAVNAPSSGKLKKGKTIPSARKKPKTKEKNENKQTKTEKSR